MWSVGGAKVDKSILFISYEGETKTPIIEESPLTLECIVDDIYEIDGFDNFVCHIVATHVDESCLNENKNNIDYNKLKPILFEFPTYEYLKTGEILGKCLSFMPKK